MTYTLISATDYQTGQIIDIIKEGSTYCIHFTDKENFYSCRLKDKEKALKIYQEIINYFVNGLYSFNDRIEIIDRLMEV